MESREHIFTPLASTFILFMLGMLHFSRVLDIYSEHTLPSKNSDSIINNLQK